MKKLNSILMLALLILFGFTACEDDEEENQQTNNNNRSMVVTIDGEEWNGEISNTQASGGIRSVYATRMSDSTQLTLTFPSDTLGQVECANGPAGVSYGEIGFQGMSNTLSGFIDVESNQSSNARGTFECELTGFSSSSDTLVLTNGSFTFNP